MVTLLDPLLPPPRVWKRARPEELLYALNDAPPAGLTLNMGVQHAFRSLMFSLYAVAAAQAIGLEPESVSAFVSGSIFLLGCCGLACGRRPCWR